MVGNQALSLLLQVFHSLANGEWLREDQFELTDQFPAAKVCQTVVILLTYRFGFFVGDSERQENRR